MVNIGYKDVSHLLLTSMRARILLSLTPPWNWSSYDYRVVHFITEYAALPAEVNNSAQILNSLFHTVRREDEACKEERI
jgi:hypothetical protein